MASFTALYDACVLYPATIRDLLMRLALTDLFRAKWSEDIHREWMSNLLANRKDLDPAKVERVRTLMDSNVRDCLVENYQVLIPALTLPDPDDRHVLAAAIRASADVIVTYNLRDFPEEVLRLYGIEARHPDQFVSHLIDLDEHEVLAAIREQRVSLRNPPIDPTEFLVRLERVELVQTVAHLRRAAHLL